MKTKLTAILALLALTSLALAQAEIKLGGKLTTCKSTLIQTGKKVCQVCDYHGKDAKVAAFGKVDDEAFWTDLKQLQKLQDVYPSIGILGQIIDSNDHEKIRKAIAKHGIKFPIVEPLDDNWDNVWNYKLKEASRTVCLADETGVITWIHVGLDDKSLIELDKAMKSQLGKGPKKGVRAISPTTKYDYEI